MFVPAVADSASRLFGMLSPVDIAVVVLLLASIAIGFWTGLVWQLVRLASVIVSFWVSYLYHPVVAEYLSSQLSEPVRRIGSALGVFILALLVCYLVTFFFRGLINAIKPEMPDRVLGAVFGLFKGVLLIGVVAFAVLQYAREGSPVRAYVRDSKGATAMATVVRAFVYVLPDGIRERVEPGANLGGLDEQGGSAPLNGTGIS